MFQKRMSLIFKRDISFLASRIFTFKYNHNIKFCFIICKMHKDRYHSTGVELYVQVAGNREIRKKVLTGFLGRYNITIEEG